MADGTADLAANTPALASGLLEARDGAATLGDKLADGAQQIPQDDGTEQTARADAVSSPVTVRLRPHVGGRLLGRGLRAVLHLAGPVGGRPDHVAAAAPAADPRADDLGQRLPDGLGSLNSALLLSVGQVLIMLSVMHFAIGLNPKNVAATVLFTLVTAAAFFALQQFFRGDPRLRRGAGKVVIIVLLMVQLASAGGTYPIQTTPSFRLGDQPVHADDLRGERPTGERSPEASRPGSGSPSPS